MIQETSDQWNVVMAEVALCNDPILAGVTAKSKLCHCGESTRGLLAGPTRHIVTYRQRTSSATGLNHPSTKPRIDIRPKMDG